MFANTLSGLLGSLSLFHLLRDIVPLIPHVAFPELWDLFGLQWLARSFLGSVLLDATGYRLAVESCSEAERTFLQWLSKLILLFQNLEEK
jgi:hypothetical protein